MDQSRYVTEIVARLGTTVVDVRHVGATGSYRVGSAPECELATAGMTMFPIVTGTKVRAIVGMPARVNGTAFTGEHVLAIGDQIELVLGLVRVSIALVPAPAAALPRTAIEKRPFAYGAGSLVAHLAAITAILAFVAPAVAPKKPEHARKPVTYKTAPDVPEVAKATKPETHVTATGTAATQHAAGSREHGGPVVMVDLGAEFAKLATGVDLAQAMRDVDPPLGDGVAEKHEFGGSFRKIDPGDIAKIDHRYKTVAHGHGAGDDFDLGAHEPPVAIAMCTTTCTANSHVREEIGDRKWSVAACYTAAKQHGTGDVIVDFEIDATGKVTSAKGKGLGAVGPCVAKVVASIPFKQSNDPTSVHYPMRFTPAAG